MLSGVELMFLGMGVVFSFLVVLVFAMLAMSRLAERLGPSQAIADSGESTLAGGAVAAHPAVRSDLVAVIAAAVARYRTTQP